MDSPNYKVVLAILLSNLFISFVGISLVIPVMPTIMNEMSVSGSIMGYMMATFSIAQLLASPITGKWADRFGRKIMIVVGLVIFSISEALFGLGKTVEVLFISRFLGGISGAFIMPAVTAYIADITTERERPKALGYMSAAINTGFIIGPGIGGFLVGLGPRAPFFVAAILAALAAVLSIVFLKEPERIHNDKLTEKVTSGFKSIFVPMYFIAFLLIFLSTFGLASFESLFSLFVDHKFSFTATDIAIIVTGGGLIGALAQVLLFNSLTKRMGEIALTRYCLILSAILVYCMTIVNSYLSVLILSCFVFIGFDLIRPAVTTYLSKIAGDEQGFVGGMNSMFTSLGNIIGPVIGGLLFDIHLNYPYYFAMSVLILAIGISMFWKRPKPLIE